jgi:hypothetical protein
MVDLALCPGEVVLYAYPTYKVYRVYRFVKDEVFAPGPKYGLHCTYWLGSDPAKEDREVAYEARHPSGLPFHFAIVRGEGAVRVQVSAKGLPYVLDASLDFWPRGSTGEGGPPRFDRDEVL